MKTLAAKTPAGVMVWVRMLDFILVDHSLIAERPARK